MTALNARDDAALNALAAALDEAIAPGVRREEANAALVHLADRLREGGGQGRAVASPANCRNRLMTEGKPYPKSGCAHCKTGGLTGCPYERDVHRDRPQPAPPSTLGMRAAEALLSARSYIGACRPNDEDDAAWWDELTELADALSATAEQVVASGGEQ